MTGGADQQHARHVGRLALHPAQVPGVRDGIATLARVTADLEKERAERRRIEARLSALSEQLEELHEELRQNLESQRAMQHRVAELEEQLQQRDDALGRLNADLQKEAADCRLAEEQLRSVGDMSAQLRQYLALFEESKKVFRRTQEQLETRLQANLSALSESESRLQKESSERQRLEEALEDRLHQARRLALAPASRALYQDLRDAGIPACVAGAGPSLLAFETDEPGDFLDLGFLETGRPESGATSKPYLFFESTRWVMDGAPSARAVPPCRAIRVPAFCERATRQPAWAVAEVAAPSRVIPPAPPADPSAHGGGPGSFRMSAARGPHRAGRCTARRRVPGPYRNMPAGRRMRPAH